MTTPRASRRTIAVLHAPRTIGELVAHVTRIVAALQGNPHFPCPVPSLATLERALLELQDAEAAVQTRTVGTAERRDQKRSTLHALLEQLRAHVQATADAQRESAGPIIQSAGLALRKTPAQGAPAFRARIDAASGVVKVVAPAACRRASYDWQYSLDGGETWTRAPSTLQARTTIPGLPPGTLVQLRFCATTKAGEGDWSPPISIFVP